MLPDSYQTDSELVVPKNAATRNVQLENVQLENVQVENVQVENVQTKNRAEEAKAADEPREESLHWRLCRTRLTYLYSHFLCEPFRPSTAKGTEHQTGIERLTSAKPAEYKPDFSTRTGVCKWR